jgi:hypothetical protein
MYWASFSGQRIPAFIAAAALGFYLTKFLNSSDYSSFDFGYIYYYNLVLLIIYFLIAYYVALAQGM